MTSIRQKISVGFYAFAIIIALLTLFFYSDLRYLERRIDAGVVVYEFLDALMESRLQEKNYTLYQGEEYLLNAKEYAGKAVDILAKNRQAFLALQSERELQELTSLVHEYAWDLSRYIRSSATGTLPFSEAKPEVQLTGSRLNTLAQTLAKAERTHLGSSINQSQWALLVTVVIITITGIVTGRMLSKASLRPLEWLEEKLAAIGNGRYKQLEPVSADLEIVSMSRAVNRMLHDIETRNRHLMQSEKLVSLGTLASGVAHELNNPLSNISASCQILIEEIEQNNDIDTMEWLEQIDRETERARLIVQSVLEFSRENRIQKQRVSLHKIVDDSLLLLGRPDRLRIQTMGVPRDLHLRADAQKLAQVFINLFQNAIDAGGPEVAIKVRAGIAGESKFSLADGMITGKRPLSGHPGNQWVFIELIDNGPGIPSEVLPRVFDPFFTTKEVGHGDGLGLYITQEIIDLHGGYISVGSTPETGTTFIIYLPCDDEQDTENNPAS